jgi:hypothetical protein
VGGLPDHIRVDVAMRAPQDLPTAMYLARAFELRANAMLAMVPAARLGRHGRYSSGHSSRSPACQPAALDSRGLPPCRRPALSVA